MSQQHIDDSPNSDNNIMDISEQTTLSQESFGLSPETEHRMSSAAASDTNGFSDSDTTSKIIGSVINGKSASLTATTTTTNTAAINAVSAAAAVAAAAAAAAAAATERKMTTISNVTSCTSNRNSNSNSNSNSTNQHDNKFNDSSLDNRILVTNKNTITSSKQRIGMTLVDMHPLMINDNEDDDDDADIDDFTDSSTALDGACNQDSGFHNNTDDRVGSPMHVSPLQQRFNTLGLPATNKSGHAEKSYLSSGESDADVSQCQASVEPTFQSVALTNYSTGKISDSSSNNGRNVGAGVAAPKASGGSLRKIPLTAELMVTAKEDDSSIETISNNSFDDDIDVDDDVDDDDDDGGCVGGANNGLSFMECKSNRHPASNESILNSSVSATKNSENGIRLVSQSQVSSGGGGGGIFVTLPNGQTRDIDMKVIEPYKRCLSHGGYIKSPGHNAIVIFSACYLPDRSRADYHYVMENLFLYVIKTLEQFVTEDYILIYLHGGSNRNTVPPLPWLKKCYHLLDRRIRKSLKNLYMVHPTFWLKSVVWMARPFISSKFWRKLVYIRTLDDLYRIIPVEKAAVPEKVKIYDRKHS